MKVLIAIDEKKFVPIMLDYIFKHNFPSVTEFKVLHVIEPAMVGSYMSVLPLPLLDEISKEAWADGEKLVRRVALKLRDHFHSPNIKELVVSGFIAREIVQEAKEFHADLIIIGSHGKHGVEKFVLGSVSSKVAAQAQCSVLIVREKAESKRDDIHEFIVAGLKEMEV